MNNQNLPWQGKMTWKYNWWLYPFGVLFLLGLFEDYRLAIIGVLFFVWAFLDAYVTDYKITEKNAFAKNGILLKKVQEIEFNSPKITMHQSFFGKLINYGDIIIEESDKSVVFHAISNPKEVLSKISIN